jgi:hypothetical protein
MLLHANGLLAGQLALHNMVKTAKKPDNSCHADPLCSVAAAAAAV